MQLILSASALLALVAQIAALQVTSPAEGSTIDLGKGNKIEWASVSSDPDTFNIVITNNNVNPPVSVTVAENVQTSSGSYEIEDIEGIVPGGNYRVNFESDSPQNSGILAQSGQFTVAEAGGDTSLASFSSSTPSGVTATASRTTSGASASETSSDEEESSASASESASASDTDSTGSSTRSATAASATATGSASTVKAFGGAGVLAMLALLFA